MGLCPQICVFQRKTSISSFYCLSKQSHSLDLTNYAKNGLKTKEKWTSPSFLSKMAVPAFSCILKPQTPHFHVSFLLAALLYKDLHCNLFSMFNLFFSALFWIYSRFPSLSAEGKCQLSACLCSQIITDSINVIRPFSTNEQLNSIPACIRMCFMETQTICSQSNLNCDHQSIVETKQNTILPSSTPRKPWLSRVQKNSFVQSSLCFLSFAPIKRQNQQIALINRSFPSSWISFFFLLISLL